MSRFIEINSLPLGKTIEDVKNVFRSNSFNVTRGEMIDGNAVLQLENPDVVTSIEFKYEQNNQIDELSGAKFRVLNEDFEWPAEIQKQEKPHFVLEENTQIYPSFPKFVQIQSCDPKILKNLSDQEIKILFTSKNYKIGRILKTIKSVFLEFLDEGELERLEADFSALMVKNLGEFANITVPENFNYDEAKKNLILEPIVQIEQPKQLEQRWSVRPQQKRPEPPITFNKSSTNIFWGIVVAVWGFYVVIL